MFGSRRQAPPQGFTLLETVAALGMFVIVVVTVVNAYLTYSRAQRLGSQRQKIITEANLLLDQMAREIRTLELAYWGTLDYSNDAAPETLYWVDVNAAEAGNPYANTNIYRQEHELVLFNNGGDETNTNDTLVAYVFNRRDPITTVDLCANDAGTMLFPGTLGLYRFTRAGAAATVCERLFNIPGLNVVDAGFFLTQPFQPYPDDVDPATDIQAALDADCGPGAGANFNGSVCTCTAANRTTACFSSTCTTTTGGQCAFGPNAQPAVTVFFTVQDANNPGTRLTFQSTVVQRLYKR
ncbi:MAG: hypothetical protein Q7S23_05190 [bacterium]|nr:hypothetical protein [bacterium]